MLPAALAWLRTAQECFDDEHGSLTSGLLTSVAMLVVGLERVFHLEEMEDRGFALLSGGNRPPSRYTVGAWRRHIPWYAADAFCRRTNPWERIRGRDVWLSLDEHTVPRWTKMFSIRKGYVTTRNKHMRCEKLFYGYCWASWTLCWAAAITVSAHSGWSWGNNQRNASSTADSLSRAACCRIRRYSRVPTAGVCSAQSRS